MQGVWKQNSNSTDSLIRLHLWHCKPDFLSLEGRGLRHVLSQSPERSEGAAKDQVMN